MAMKTLVLLLQVQPVHPDSIHAYNALLAKRTHETV